MIKYMIYKSKLFKIVSASVSKLYQIALTSQVLHNIHSRKLRGSFKKDNQQTCSEVPREKAEYC